MTHQRWGYLFGAVALLCALYAPVAHAGGDSYVHFTNATNLDGTNCTFTGAFDGHTVPSCLGSANGTFDLDTPLLTPGAAPTFTAQEVNFIPQGTVNSGNVCFSEQAMALPAGVTVPWGATVWANAVGLCTGSGVPFACCTGSGAGATCTNPASVTISQSLAANGCSDAAGTLCVSATAGAATAIWNAQAGLACASSACTDGEHVITHVTHLSSSNCSGGSTMNVIVTRQKETIN